MASDFHTHTYHPGATELVSVPAAVAASRGPDEAGHFRSLEYHPWQLPEEFAPPVPAPEELLGEFDALGEIGLDRLRGPELAVQRQYLERLLAAAKAAQKPVVIHAVRCDAELFAALKNFSLPVLIHGFRGGAARLARLLDAGFTVSLAYRAWETPGVPELIRARRAAGIGVETDDRSDLEIGAVAAEAAESLRLRNFPEIADRNFGAFLAPFRRA